MQHGQPSRTALRVAIRRAAHQLMENPRVLDDPIALPLVAEGYTRDLDRACHPVAQDFRCFMAARSRFTEDQLAQAVSRGVIQYVVLGAGLDTFAYRNPFPTLRVFEVDFPATQEWKRFMLHQASIPIPPNLTFVPLDFEHQSVEHGALTAGLLDAGFDSTLPAFFSWLGVAPYLTLEAFRATLTAVANLPIGTGLCFDYAFNPKTLTGRRRVVFDLLSARVAAAGEPFRLFFSPAELETELLTAGFTHVEHCDTTRLNHLYFNGRADRLHLPDPGLGALVCASN
jgi:methyltransferase (TIGR00027 family)